MSDLRDFLAWFDGFCENIKARPSAEQWAKVVERIRKIQVPAAPVAAPRLATANPEPKPRPAISSGQAMSAGP